jgi:putative flippase GtrA
MISAKFRKELTRFLISGITAVGTDCAVYTGLLYFGTTASLAKGLGFIFGTVVTYFLNKFWTFQKPHREWQEVLRFVGAYAVSMGINVGINHLVLDKTNIVILAFLSATGVSTLFNFICLKVFVFKK